MRINRTTVFLLSAAAVGLSAVVANRFAYTLNPRYTIREVQVNAGLTSLTKEQITAVLEIKIGGRMSDFNCSERREFILRSLPQLREIRIEKIFPDKIRITPVDRMPVARIGSRRLAVAADRVIMSIPRSKLRQFPALPAIFDKNIGSPQPGDILDSEKAVIALDILDLFTTLVRPGFRIIAADTGHRIYLRLETDTGKEICIPWEYLDSRSNMLLALKLAAPPVAKNKTNRRFIVLVDQRRVIAG